MFVHAVNNEFVLLYLRQFKRGKSSNIMSVYMIVQTNINDREAYNQLIDKIIPLLSVYKAKILAADDEATFLEGHYSFGRTVIVEFESEKHLVAWNEHVRASGLADVARSASNTYIVSYVRGVSEV